MGIDKLIEKYELQVKWRAFPLHPDTPDQGITLEELFKKKNRDVDLESLQLKMMQTADSLGLPFGRREKTYNSRLAQEVGLWAETKGQGETFHMAVFKAYFAEGKNIAGKEVLQELMVSSNLDPEQGLEVIEKRTFSQAVDQDWEMARSKEVHAVPTFFMGFHKLVGAQPDYLMENMVKQYIQ